MTPSNQMVNSIILNPLISRLNRLNNGYIWDNYIELCLMDSRNVFNLSKATTKECPRYEVSLNQQSFSPILILQNEPRPLKLFFFTSCWLMVNILVYFLWMMITIDFRAAAHPPVFKHLVGLIRKRSCLVPR
jgi:hypothetical protein